MLSATKALAQSPSPSAFSATSPRAIDVLREGFRLKRGALPHGTAFLGAGSRGPCSRAGGIRGVLGGRCVRGVGLLGRILRLGLLKLIEDQLYYSGYR